MAHLLGLNAKLYRNTGTYGSPTWVLVDNVKDLSINKEKGEADVTTRANNGWEATAATLKSATIEWDMVYDPADADYTAIETAWEDGSAIEFAFMDGLITVAGTKGYRMTCAVFGFSRDEALTEAVMVNVSVKPTYAANGPAPYTVPA